MADLPVFTYQTRIHLQPPQHAALKAYAELYGKVERTLFAATQTGIHAMDLKQEYLRHLCERAWGRRRVSVSVPFASTLVIPPNSAGDWSMVIETVSMGP